MLVVVEKLLQSLVFPAQQCLTLTISRYRSLRVHLWANTAPVAVHTSSQQNLCNPLPMVVTKAAWCRIQNLELSQFHYG